MLHEVNLTTARNLSPLFDEAVERERPVMIVRGGLQRGLLLSRDALLRLLAPYEFDVDVLPEEDGNFTLWLGELDIGGHGPTLRDARQDLLAAIRSYVRDYASQFDFLRHLPDKARQEPYILRLSLTRDDADLIVTLFGGVPPPEPGVPAPTTPTTP